VLVAVLVGLLSPGGSITAGQSEERPPLTQDIILDAIRLKSFSPDVLLDFIKTSGVAFRLNDQDTERFRRAGASDDVLRVIASSYHLDKKTPGLSSAAPVASAAPVRSEAQPAAIRVPQELQQARLVRQVSIEQPPQARAAQTQLEREHGPVRLEVTISPEGAVSGVKALSGHPVLVELASETIKQWKYRPAIQDGRPVSVITEIGISFTDPTLVARVGAPPAQPTPPAVDMTKARAAEPTGALSESLAYNVNGGVGRLIVAPKAPFEFRYEVLKDPDRVALDFNGGETLIDGRIPRTIAIGDELVKQIRVGVPRPGTNRVVVELQPNTTFVVDRMDAPDRVSVQIKNPAVQAAPAPKPDQPAPVSLPTKAARNRTMFSKHRIMLDPGHGGRDTGAIGATGVMEKDITLDICLRLGKALTERLGQQVIYTRQDDTFVTLPDRANSANAMSPELFLSIHANAEPTRGVAGFEAFVSEKAAVALASSNGDGEELLLARQSRSLATYVHAALQLAHPSGARTQVKSGPFHVLTEATMPAALAEVGFLSSSADEQFLSTPEQRERIAEALYEAVASYLGGLDRLQVASR
jgi:N-acetylmuramoyl-L-alanine amidase